MGNEVVITLIAGGFSVLVALIAKIGYDNRQDHGVVHKSLGRIEQKIDGHISSHDK